MYNMLSDKISKAPVIGSSLAPTDSLMIGLKLITFQKYMITLERNGSLALKLTLLLKTMMLSGLLNTTQNFRKCCKSYKKGILEQRRRKTYWPIRQCQSSF